MSQSRRSGTIPPLVLPTELKLVGKKPSPAQFEAFAKKFLLQVKLNGPIYENVALWAATHFW